MLFYLILFTVCVSLSFFSNFLHRNKYENKTLLWLIDFLPFLILIIVTGFRFEVGTDYGGYVRNFETLRTGEINRIELSFRLIVEFSQLLGLSVQFVFLVYAILTYVCIFLGIKYFDPEAKYRHYMMALLITFFLFNIFNTIRQMAAVAILFYALKFMLEKKFIRYFLLVGISYFFHKSGIVFGLFFFVALQVDIKFYLALLIVAPLMFYSNFINFMIQLFVRITGSEFYSIYATGGNARVSLSSGIGILVFYLLAVVFYIFYHQIVETDQQKLAVKLYIMYTGLYLIFLPSEIATRMLYYPMVACIIAIPLLERITFKESEKAYMQYIIIAIILLLFGNLMFNSIAEMQNGGVLDYAINFVLLE